MKILIYIFLIIYMGCASSNKKLVTEKKNLHSADYLNLKHFNNDTALYVMDNFMNQKEKYIGKNIGLMIRDLEIPILDVSYFSGQRTDIINRITLYLYKVRGPINKGQKTQIVISLTTPLNR